MKIKLYLCSRKGKSHQYSSNNNPQISTIMKKVFYAAIALVTCVLAFSSCNEKDKADNPLVGTWSYRTQTTSTGWYSVYEAIFTADYSFEARDYAYGPETTEAHDCNYMAGKYEIAGNIATIHYQSHGWIHSGVREPVSGFEPYDEKVQFEINGNTLTVIRNYGTSDAWKEIYTKQ